MSRVSKRLDAAGGQTKAVKSIWPTRALGDVCDVIGGGTPSKEIASYYGGPIPWATVRDMKADLIENTECSITADAVQASATNIIPAGNVIIATRVGLGKVCILGQDTAINQDLRGIVPRNGNVKVKFLYHWLRYIAPRIVAEGSGATVQGVKLPFIKSLQMPLPIIAEQDRIIRILDATFEGIATSEANTQRNLTNSRDIFDSALELRLACTRPGWVTKPLSELCDFKHGFAFKSEHFLSEGEYILLTPGNFYEHGGYRNRGEKQKYYGAEFPSEFLLNSGDLLVAMTEQAAGLLGSPIIVPESGYFLHNQRLGLVKSRPGVPWLNRFFFYVFNTKSFRKAVHDGASGVKVRHTSPTKLGEVLVSFPMSLKAQQAVVTEMEEAYSETLRLEAVYTKKLIALKQLEESLLHQAFSGNL